MKISTVIFGLAATVFALDIYAQVTVTTPIPALDPIVGTVRSFYSPLDDMLPVLPLWAWLGVAGAGVRFGLGK